jgi:hypothetical protein
MVVMLLHANLHALLCIAELALQFFMRSGLHALERLPLRPHGVELGAEPAADAP